MSGKEVEALVLEFAELKQLISIREQLDVLVKSRMRTLESLLVMLKGG